MYLSWISYQLMFSVFDAVALTFKRTVAVDYGWADNGAFARIFDTNVHHSPFSSIVWMASHSFGIFIFGLIDIELFIDPSRSKCGPNLRLGSIPSRQWVLSDSRNYAVLPLLIVVLFHSSYGYSISSLDILNEKLVLKNITQVDNIARYQDIPTSIAAFSGTLNYSFLAMSLYHWMYHYLSPLLPR